jgi:hypothetical protein
MIDLTIIMTIGHFIKVLYMKFIEYNLGHSNELNTKPLIIHYPFLVHYKGLQSIYLHEL